MALSLEKYQREFASALESLSWDMKPANLYEPAEYILSIGGKRLRPVLTFIGAQLYTDDLSKAVPPALAVEIFHNFSLLHDDIMDDAPLRRGKPTVHEKWNANIGILSGDVMLVKAFQQIEKVGPEMLPKVLPVFSKMAVEVCEGQQMDMDFETRDDVTLVEYLEMIAYKTSVLIGAAFQMGALVGGASQSESELLYEFGLDLGISFQIMDDYLDVYGDPEKFGKQVGGDILSNKKTLLLIEALNRSKGTSYEDSLKNWLSTTEISDKKVAEVTKIFTNLNIDTFALDRAREYYDKALSLLDKLNLSDNKLSEIKEFAQWLLNRDR